MAEAVFSLRVLAVSLAYVAADEARCTAMFFSSSGEGYCLTSRRTAK